MNSASRRPYTSPRRAQGARETTDLILSAAWDLFVAQGYTRTTIDQIADRAGVSRPTVFANAGSKRALLKQLRDLALAGDEEPVSVIQRSWYQEALTEPDPERSIRLHARNLTRVFGRYADLDEVIHQAAGSDPELREFWRTAESQRRTGALTFIDALMAKGSLRQGLDRDAAIDVLWAVAATDPYRRLVGEAGWNAERFERWLADTLCNQLLPADRITGRTR
jgi:AcrR family transcriptional regulator